MQKRLLTLLATSFLSFKSFDSFSRDTDIVDNTEHYGSELMRLMAEQAILSYYNQIDFGQSEKPEYKTFRKAMLGFLNLQKEHVLSPQKVLTIIDYSLPSTVERMWVIDLKAKKMLFHELVAHGRSNGNLYAASFSNQPNSNSTSLGFSITAETYEGKFGRALRLDGVEQGINDRMRERGIVLHGADYVSQAIAESAGRLGRSLGCPAVAWDNKDALIDAIMGGNVIYSHAEDMEYNVKSLLLNAEQAFEVLADQSFDLEGAVVASI
ncbi:murein L,D-transpeptidase catalytic domain family protein [Cesiribacter andamanensis]|uniref:L,D-transpeptidase catalytic domain protein n=1 Tax=Cesiribacter andamanensis AMV16 TaxID=1279009 RepID=M7N2L5_9BACT|nr:murein L,D-transpeptidase catalytic domain family protein [Cesiribacter andamanensis]EMR01461.1 hypothetical protein ADICEAN_03417 [Cesiribacter andamanensis AMV16]